MKKFNKKSTLTVLAIFSFLGLFGIVAAATSVSMGTADNFVILAGSTITNTGNSVINGDLGLSPGTAVIGFPPAIINGVQHINDGPATQAKIDLITAYDDAAGQSPVSVPSALGGTTKTPGAYNSADGTFEITGTLTLDAQGDPDAVFVFEAASTLITADNSKVVLANGAQACKVFWQVGSSATLGTNSIFKGNILALASITLTTGASVDGSVLARNGAVTLDTNSITKATCGSVLSTINVVKTVINDNGKTKVVADFPLFVNGTQVVSGVTNSFVAPATYTVTETADADYTKTFSGDCDANGNVSLALGESKFCIVINDDIAPPTMTYSSSSVGGSVYVAPVPPLIDVVKVPSPLSLPDGPGSVTYTYTLGNKGTVPVGNITMVGDTCSPIVFVSGDINADNKMNVGETWIYRCSTTLSNTHTNTVVATGWANGLSTTDIASSTVVVGAPVVPPLIHVTKVPSTLMLIAGGGLVTYTEVVTNPGTVALNNVRLEDDKCPPVYVSGDVNRNNKLDNDEAWTYTCQIKLTKTTTNTAVATGDANGLTVRDFAIATVIVFTPDLPKTGSDSWNMFLSGGIALFVAATFMVIMKRKRA